MSDNSDDDEDDRDAALLRHMALARARPDGVLRDSLLLSQLLGRHRPNITRIVRYRAYSLRPSDADIDEIVAGVLRRLAQTLDRKLDFSKPFRWVVADNIDWEVTDFARQRRRLADREVSSETLELTEPAAPETATLEREARELHARVAGLDSERDRTLLIDQMMFGFSPAQTAERHGMTPGAVHTATHRALKKLDHDAQDIHANRELDPTGPHDEEIGPDRV